MTQWIDKPPNVDVDKWSDSRISWQSATFGNCSPLISVVIFVGAWSWYACGLATGRAICELPLTPTGTVSRILCGTGSGTLQLPVTDPATPADWWQATLPGRTLLVGDLNGNPDPTDPVFPSIETGEGLRDPSNLSDHLRDAFDDAGYHWVTSHVYRKTVATLMDEHGLSARQAADQLGQADITTTQRHYFGRRQVARDAAPVLEAIAEQLSNNDSDNGR